MSTRYYCDGCEQQVGSDREFALGFERFRAISEQPKTGDPMQMFTDFLAKAKRWHLCEICEGKMLKRIDPRYP